MLVSRGHCALAESIARLTLADVSARFAQEAEKRKLALALKQANGDKGRAADLLQINFKTLAAKLRQYGLD